MFLTRLLIWKSLNQRIKATRAHATSTMALTIGTLAALHRSSLQQSWSHLVIVYPCCGGQSFLQSSEVAQPLTNIFLSMLSFLTSISALTQRSCLESQVSALVLLAGQSSQFVNERQLKHLRPYPVKTKYLS